MRIKRGLNSMRVRRRQSDAKWRASVASCYDTLKFVIPDSGKLPKRKISKETDKHINELEKVVSNLLTQEANALNKSILWRTGKQWSLATLPHIRKEFEEKQAQLFEQSNQGRRRYSMLADIEDEILHMAADTSKMTVISGDVGTQSAAANHNRGGKHVPTGSRDKILRKELTKPCTEPQAHSTPCSKRVRRNPNTDIWASNLESTNAISAICERLPNTNYYHTSSISPDCRYSVLHEGPITSMSTPSKMCYTSDSEKLFSPVAECQDLGTPVYCNRNYNQLSVQPPLTSPSLSKVAKQLDFVSEETDSPMRPSCMQEKVKDLGSLFGFTPIKLPSPDLDMTPLRLPPLQMMDDTPTTFSSQKTSGSRIRTTYPPQTPKRESGSQESDDEETKSLLCFETFDMPEDGPDWERTPSKNTSVEVKTSKSNEQEEQKANCKRKIGFGGRRCSVRKTRDHVPKCRKNLEKLYPSNSDVMEEKPLPVITGVFDKDSNCSDFDGYFLFYRQVVDELQQHMSRSEIASPSVAALVSQMWSDMSPSDKETLATLAALEGSQDSNSSSNLSDDLQELEVKPLDPSNFIHAERIGMLKNDLQIVPTADSKVLTATVDRILQTYDIQEVPVGRKLSQNNLHDSRFLAERSELMQGISLEIDKADSDYTGISECTDLADGGNSQVVPDISVVRKDVLLSSSQSSTAFITYS